MTKLYHEVEYDGSHTVYDENYSGLSDAGLQCVGHGATYREALVEYLNKLGYVEESE